MKVDIKFKDATLMLSEQEINYMQDVAPEVTKKHLFFKIFSGENPQSPPWRLEMFWISYANIRLLLLNWTDKTLYTGGDKLNPFALPHRVVARAREEDRPWHCMTHFFI